VQQGGATTLSSFTGPIGPGAGGVLGAPGGIGGFGGGVGGGGLPGFAGASGLVAGPTAAAAPPLMSGAGTFAGSEEAQLSRMAGVQAAEGEGGWTGFAPTGQGGRGGGQDGEHRDRYAGKADLFGELPAAYPPVLGL
jgi:hypothetical protein